MARESPAPGGPVLQIDPHLRRVALTIGYMIITAGAVYAISMVWPLIRTTISVLLPFVVALVFAYILNPIVTWLSVRLKLGRFGALMVFYAAVALLVSSFVVFVGPILSEQVRTAARDITEAVPRAISNYLKDNGIEPEELLPTVDQWLRERGVNLDEMLREAAASQGVQTAAQGAAKGGAEILGAILRTALRLGIALVESTIFLIIVVLLSFYFIVEFGPLRGIIDVMIPDAHRERTYSILGKIDTAVGGYLRGQLIAASLVGFLVMIGLTFLGLGQYALLIGLLAIVGNLIPYVGTPVAAAPAVMYMLLSDTNPTVSDKLFGVAMVVALFAVIQTLDGLLFQPKIVGQNAQLHPVAVILALAAGANFGLLGMIVAVPVACVIRVLWKEFYWDERRRRWEESTGRRSLDMTMPLKKAPKRA